MAKPSLPSILLSPYPSCALTPRCGREVEASKYYGCIDRNPMVLYRSKHGCTGLFAQEATNGAGVWEKMERRWDWRGVIQGDHYPRTHPRFVHFLLGRYPRKSVSNSVNQGRWLTVPYGQVWRAPDIACNCGRTAESYELSLNWDFWMGGKRNLGCSKGTKPAPAFLYSAESI